VARQVNAAERLLLYVVQGLLDQEAYPSRTRIVKILYLIDVEYYRRHRQTLTGLKWICFKYGPYAFSFPRIFQKLDLTHLEETEETTADGRQIFRYETVEEQDISDLVRYSDKAMTDAIIEKWALENLNALLNHAYFETEPMEGAEKGDMLDFSKITVRTHEPVVLTRERMLSPEEQRDRKNSLTEARKRWEERVHQSNLAIEQAPPPLDEPYFAVMRRLAKEEEREVPIGAKVTVA